MIHGARHRLVVSRAAVAVLFWLTLFSKCLYVAAELPDPPAIDEGNLEVLTRGPIHEAFAEQVGRNPSPGIIVSAKPPDPINELPPELRPTEDVVWMGGYWSWDEDRNDFVWVSGAWRVPPSRQRWVPGYWAEVDGGYQWTAGFWTADDSDELEYLAPPPESLENGPSSPPMGNDYFWIPGCWTHQSDGYHWRPGFWSPSTPGQVWVPDRYVWTPLGCIFVAGYADYLVGERGTVFAPVYVPSSSRHVDYQYTPSCVISGTSFYLHLWIRPSDHHYCFGDFYQHRRAGDGIYRWYDYHRRGHGYCPLYVGYMHRHRHDAHEHLHRMTAWHRYFKKNHDLRPRHTLSDQRQFATRHAKHKYVRHSLLGRSLDEAIHRPDQPDRFLRLSKEKRDRMVGAARRMRNIQVERQRVERQLAGRKDDASASKDKDGPRAIRRGKLNLPRVDRIRRRETAEFNPRMGKGMKENSDGNRRNLSVLENRPQSRQLGLGPRRRPANSNDEVRPPRVRDNAPRRAGPDHVRGGSRIVIDQGSSDDNQPRSSRIRRRSFTRREQSRSGDSLGGGSRQVHGSQREMSGRVRRRSLSNSPSQQMRDGADRNDRGPRASSRRRHISGYRGNSLNLGDNTQRRSVRRRDSNSGRQSVRRDNNGSRRSSVRREKNRSGVKSSRRGSRRSRGDSSRGSRSGRRRKK